jgi:colanic acid biosynthesis glycosyl transferase WcaI
MRVLLLNQFYVPDTAATGQLLADVAEGLAAEGHEVHVICSRRAYSGGGKILPATEEMNGVHVHRVGATGFGRGKIVGRMFDYLSFYVLAARRAFLLPKMDVCIALTTPPFIALIGLMLRRFRGTKVVVWTMDVYPEVAVAFDVIGEKSLLRSLLARLSRHVYRAAAAVISLGDVMTDRLAEAGASRDKIFVVHNWVPREHAEEPVPSRPCSDPIPDLLRLVPNAWCLFAW